MMRWNVVRVWAMAIFILLTLLPASSWSQVQEAGESREPASVEERRIRYAILQERAQLQAAYKKRREMLDMKELGLKTLEREVDKKLEELQRLKAEIAASRKEDQANLAQRAKELSKMVEKMEPAQAATLIAELDESLAVVVLSGLRPKSAGRLLNNMQTEKAAELSTVYTRQGRAAMN